ncbi:protein C-mannosyl-transferase DPY19L1-like [Alosa pseudoharengus]|uniref:protein C-mannosyl-transferase DPY19L1-like n=1 Tax=Alosa pseudoharengus TaxID=34774 RepID=UPI003F8B8CFD
MPSKQIASRSSFFPNIFFNDMSSFVQDNFGVSHRAFLNLGVTLLMALLAGIVHWRHLDGLFENDRHFSHLSTLEKEMAFRTEMGLYYSYYKNYIESPSITSGLRFFVNDHLSESPKVINALKRFNLYPEIVIGNLHRTYTGFIEFFGLPSKACYDIHRINDVTPVEGCEGLGDPAYFYVTCVFVLNGLMMSLLFLYGTYLSSSRLGGLVSVLCFFFNHAESTRVMWTPPLRESFSYPFFVMQMLILTYIIRNQNPGRKVLAALGACNVLFMLPWPTSQYILLTQVACLYACYVMGYINPSLLKSLISVHMVTASVCFVLLFGNTSPSSLYGSALLAGWVHISNVISSKFSLNKDFLSMMYSCVDEYDYMELEQLCSKLSQNFQTILGYIKTLLLPLNLIIMGFIGVKTVYKVTNYLKQPTVKEEETQGDTEQVPDLNNGEVVFNGLQLLVFAVLAVMVMKLKVFLAPHMCIMASLLCSRPLFNWLGDRSKHHMVIFCVLSIMAVQGAANFQKQNEIQGGFRSPAQEELLQWINTNTPTDAVFGGAAPTMASVLLSTRRPIVNHPHDEDPGQRERTKMAYSMYSRKPVMEAVKTLMDLKVDYFILENTWCFPRAREGCSLPEIWDAEDEENRGKPALCALLLADSHPHFRTAFENKVFKVLQVPKPTR